MEEVKEIDGTKQYLVNGKRHRIDGPAFISDDVKIWYHNNVKHRMNKPAMEFKNGNKFYFYYGHKSDTYEEHLAYIESKGDEIIELKWYQKVIKWIKNLF